MDRIKVVDYSLMALSVVIVAVACLALFYPETPTPEKVPETPAVVAPADDDLCGRYHNRTRTTRFFKRVV